ncbi:transmembrane protein 14C-like [Tachypleus tridentatus]|uniref:transmembrane protein 14C-like n=1 Tax=Tachypleus tridentatus TaxID=6853 RepID=UPI003FD4485F
MGVDYVSLGYAAAVAVGGIIGYVKAGSVPSLAAGLAFGGLMGYGVYQTSQDPNNYLLSLVTSGVLGGVMGARYYRSGKFMPAGLITVLSFAMVLRFTARALNSGYRR